MIDLILAAPSYGPTEPEANRHLRAAIMHASNNGCRWLGDATPNRMKFDAARELIATQVTNDEHVTDAAFVVWVDSDVVLDTDSITTLAHRATERSFEFLSGIYFQREGKHFPLIAHRVPDKGFQWCIKWPEHSVFPMDGCGFGLVLTSVGLLRRIGQKWFNYERFSEDFDFCVKAKDHGAQLWVDSSVVVGHLAEPVPVTMETYKAAHPEFFGGDDNEVREAGVLREDGGGKEGQGQAQVQLRPVR